MKSRDSATRNRILRNLAPKNRAALVSKMEPVRLEIKQLLYEKDKPIDAVYFPLSGVMSMVSQDEQGQITEVGTVGNEGMVGLPLFLHGDTMPLTVFAQIPGECLKMDRATFQDAVADGNGELPQVLNRYTQALLNQLAQHAACNASHTVETRGARWLLMCHDRMEQDEFPLTHEFLSQMLGVRRASVTEVLNKFQNAGLITYTRGVITVLYRKGLVCAGCHHYELIAKEYDRLLGGNKTSFEF